MDVMMSAGRGESRAASDASSDWGDWADRQVAQGDTPGDAAVEAVGEGSGVDSSGKNEEDDQWVRKQMEQPSAVLSADNRAWDYVLQMVVDEGEVLVQDAAVEDIGCNCSCTPNAQYGDLDSLSVLVASSVVA